MKDLAYDSDFLEKIRHAVSKVDGVCKCVSSCHISQFYDGDIKICRSKDRKRLKLKIEISLPAEEILMDKESVALKHDDWKLHPIISFVKVRDVR